MTRALNLIDSYNALQLTEVPVTNEGVVKIPPKLYKKAHDFLWWSVLSRHYDKYMASESIDPKFYRYAKKLCTNYKVRKGEVRPYFAETFEYDLRRLSSNYPRAEAPELKLTVVTDPVKMDNGAKFMAGVGGRYVAKNKDVQSVLINCDTKMFGKFPIPNRDLSVSAFKSQMDSMVTTLEHELMHSVQHSLLKPLDANQFASATSDQYPKATENELYYLSPVEFDPQLISALSDYKDLLLFKKAYDDTKTPELDTFKDVTAPKRVAKNSVGAEAKLFFQALKSHDSKRWRIAVKKFRELLVKRYAIEL
jgi:hypothetical protein